MRSEAHQLLGYDETHQLLQSLWKTHPHLVDALVPGTLSMVQVWQVFRAVLETRMTLYRLLLIVESLLEQSQTTQNRKDLVDSVHQALAHSLLQFMVGTRENEIAVIEFDDELREVLLLNSTEEIDRFIETDFAVRFRRSVLEAEKNTQANWPTVNRLFLVKPDIRFWVSRVMSRFSEDLHVFSPWEIPKHYLIQSIQLIRLRDIFPG
jgi:flagellar biosynthesis protein FlhA